MAGNVDEDKIPDTPEDMDRSSRASGPNFFGRKLRALRESYSQRVAQRAGVYPALPSKTNIAAVIVGMKAAKYPISMGAWSELENGINHPRHGLEFLGAVKECLRLTDEEYEDLFQRLAYDTLYARFGSLTNKIQMPKEEWLQD